MKVGQLGIPVLSAGDVEGHFAITISRQFTELAKSHPEAQYAREVLNGHADRQRRTGQTDGSVRPPESMQEESIIKWYLWRANLVGLEQAREELQQFLSDTSSPVICACWLFNLTVDRAYDLHSGMRLVPASDMPDSEEKNRALWMLDMTLSIKQAQPKVALVVETTKDKLSSETDEWIAIVDRFRWTYLLMNLLPDVVCCGSYETTYDPASTPPGLFGNSGGGYSLPDVIVPAQREFLAEHVDELEALCSHVDAWQDSGDRQTLRIALSRFAQAKGRMNPHESMLDLGIALEMVLLNDAHTKNSLPGQLSEKFRARGAWLLGQSVDERKLIYRMLKDVYTARSQVAHTGWSRLILSPKEESFPLNPFRLGERIIRKVIEMKQIPNWELVVLGGSHC